MGTWRGIREDCERSFHASGLAGLEPLRGSHIFLTGATGFAGSWILSAVAALNEISGFDLQATAVARRPAALADVAPFLLGREDIRFVATDIRQLAEIPADADWIVHLAGVPDGRHHATDPIATTSVIGEGTLRTLRLAEQAAGLRAFQFFSSGLVSMPVELTARMGPAGIYTEAKRYGEALCAAFRTQARLPIVVSRPFTFIGPFQRLDSPWAANNFLHAALNGQPIKLRGDGQVRRAFLYGSDMAVAALLQLAQGRSGDVFDLGGLNEISLVELAHTVAGEAKRPIEIRLNTAGRSGDAYHLVPDMTRSVTELGFAPAFDPTDAIRRTLRWYADRDERDRVA